MNPPFYGNQKDVHTCLHKHQSHISDEKRVYWLKDSSRCGNWFNWVSSEFRDHNEPRNSC